MRITATFVLIVTTFSKYVERWIASNFVSFAQLHLNAGVYFSQRNWC